MVDTDTVAAINRFLQEQLHATGQAKLTAIEAARLLDSAGLLPDSGRPGQELRKLLRVGAIGGGRQEPPGEKHGSWFVTRLEDGAG